MPGEEVFAVGCRDDDESKRIRIQLHTCNKTFPLWSSTVTLHPGKYRFKFAIESGRPGSGREEALDGMWGPEPHRLVTVLGEPCAEALLLMSDLDGTLVGDEEATLRFREAWRAEYRPRGAMLVYNTGRPFESAWQLIAEGHLDRPDALICSEGTEIFWFGAAGEVEQDYEWRETLMGLWEYDRLRAVLRMELQRRARLHSSVRFLPDSSGQPLIAIRVPGRREATSLAQTIQRRLRDEEGLRFDLTASRYGGVWFLLLVPPGAGKGSAALHCSRRAGFEPHRVMVAGDGPNDVSLLSYTERGFKGTLVGNHCHGLAVWAGQRRRPGVFRSRSWHALGVLEGLRHHFQKT